jgi:hypothetical protein
MLNKFVFKTLMQFIKVGFYIKLKVCTQIKHFQSF